MSAKAGYLIAHKLIGGSDQKERIIFTVELFMDFYTSALIRADSTSGVADPLAPSPAFQAFLTNAVSFAGQFSNQCAQPKLWCADALVPCPHTLLPSAVRPVRVAAGIDAGGIVFMNLLRILEYGNYLDPQEKGTLAIKKMMIIGTTVRHQELEKDIPYY